MSTPNPASGPTLNTIPAKATLLDKFITPLFFIGVGYALGFFHGNTSGKRKSLPSGG